MKTMQDLKSRVINAIDGDEEFIYDVAADSGQIVANVKHTKWFRTEVARYLCSAYPKTWGHLEKDLPA
jgi:hypothetical protein